MRCSKAERYISLKLDNQISARRAKALKVHLDQCPSCRNVLTQHRALVTKLQKLPQAEYPQYLHHRIMSNLPRSNKRSWLQSYGLSYATATVAIALSLFAGSLVGIKGYESPQNYSSQSEIDYESISFGEHTLLEYYDD